MIHVKTPSHYRRERKLAMTQRRQPTQRPIEAAVNIQPLRKEDLNNTNAPEDRPYLWLVNKDR